MKTQFDTIDSEQLIAVAGAAGWQSTAVRYARAGSRYTYLGPQGVGIGLGLEAARDFWGGRSTR